MKRAYSFLLESSALRRFRLHIPLAGVMLLLSPLAAFCGGKTTYSKFAGTYESHTGKSGPSMNVSLGEDGTATVTEATGKEIVTRFGHWADSGSQITVTFEAVAGNPAEPPMIFQPSHDELRAVTWNHAVWGSVPPPPVKKGSKVKQSYWFTPVR